MIKNIFKGLLRKREFLPNQLEGLTTISLWTAGIKYESRLRNVLNCKIHDEVKLVREANNENDSNAIHVKRLNGESLGYVGMTRAAILAPLLDNNEIDPKAYIIDLKCDMLKDIYGVKIAMNIDPSYANLFRQNIEVVDVLFDKSSKGNLYLLLNCDESILSTVKVLFKNNNISIYRSGISYKMAKNGKYYDWYFFLDEETNESFVQKVLEDRFPILKEKSNTEFNQEYLSLQELELDDLKKLNDLLIEQNASLNKNFEKSTRTLNKLGGQFEKFMNTIFTDVEFMDPSMEVLQNDVQDFSKALIEIKKIVQDKNYKGKPIKTLDNWFDVHFNTGVRDDGRIYFNKSKGVITILVSFKGEQTKDIKRLSIYN